MLVRRVQYSGRRCRGCTIGISTRMYATTTATKSSNSSASSSQKLSNPSHKAVYQPASVAQATRPLKLVGKRLKGSRMKTEPPPENLSPEKEAELQKSMQLRLSNLAGSSDVYNLATPLLDVCIPQRKPRDVSQKWSEARLWVSNKLKNMTALYMLAAFCPQVLTWPKAKPGKPRRTSLDGLGMIRRAVILIPVTLSAFRRHPKWLSGMQQEASHVYANVMRGIAEQKKNLISSNTSGEYAATARRMASKAIPGYTYIHHIHSHIRPPTVISLRVAPFYPEPNTKKNQHAIQALVRLETEQSLEVYDSEGRAVHESLNDDSAPSNSNSQPARPKISIKMTQALPNTERKGVIVPAKRRRVTEYLVFEKKMWASDPVWVIRDEMFVEAGKEALQL